MTFARAANLPKGLGRTVFRRAGSGSRTRSWRQVGRRGYASDHGQQKSSEIPWIIGSAAVFIPAAAWLIQQGPKTSDHGHGGHHEKHEEKEEEEKEEEQPQEEEPQEESKEEPKEESKDEGKDDSKEESDEKDEGSGEKADEGKSDDSDKQEADESKSEDSKSNGSETKGEKDAQGDRSGAKHPYIDDPEKSKKGVGVTETAKIHGTVDSNTGARGAGETGKSSDD